MIRKIEKEDNIAIAKVIRTALEDFNANLPGTAYYDKSTDDLYSLFLHPNSIYFVLEIDNTIVGGCGIYPTEGLEDNCTELVKLYLSKEFRGKGFGKKLMLCAINWAKQKGAASIYLESLPQLHNAIGLYDSLGFKKLENRLGNSGHFGCDLWMKLDLLASN